MFTDFLLQEYTADAVEEAAADARALRRVEAGADSIGRNCYAGGLLARYAKKTTAEKTTSTAAAKKTAADEVRKLGKRRQAATQSGGKTGKKLPVHCGEWLTAKPICARVHEGCGALPEDPAAPRRGPGRRRCASPVATPSASQRQDLLRFCSAFAILCGFRCHVHVRDQIEEVRHNRMFLSQFISEFQENDSYRQPGNTITYPSANRHTPHPNISRNFRNCGLLFMYNFFP